MTRQNTRGKEYSGRSAATPAEDIPHGHKWTEVGVIPEDWETKRIGEIASCYSGGTPSTKVPAYHNGDIPWITSGDLNKRYVTFVDGRISQDGLAHSSAQMVEANTLLVALYGATSGVTAISKMSAAINQAVLAIIPHHEDMTFLYFKLDSLKAWLVSTYTQGGQPNLSGKIIKEIVIPLPPPREQRAIAKALSDVDGLIEAFEKLIAKKRAIKQGAMQQLLTGKTRLPGHYEEWETVVLGDHVNYLRNGTHSRAELMNDGSVKYLHYGDIHTSSVVRLNPQVTQLPHLPEGLARNFDRLQDGDLVLVDASEDLEGVGKSVEISGADGIEIVAGLHTIAARFDKAVIADGFKAYLQFCPAFRNQLKRLAAGLKIYASNRAHVSSVEIPLPSVSEQQAIATILSDMDAEIEALERRLEKTRAIKKGMMQKLLTGRVRLVKPESKGFVT